MNARWAYYISGTIVPLNIKRTYGYFAVKPTAEVTLNIKGSAQLYYPTKRTRLIDTLSWPGLSIKGIAAIGPTVDLWGEMESKLILSGDISAGAKVQFPSYEVYFPQNDESKEFQQWLTPNLDSEEAGGVSPILDASVQASVDVRLKLTPELNLGIYVRMRGGTTVVDAQTVAYIDNTVHFHLNAGVSGGIGGGVGGEYNFFVDYLYNFGVRGRATFISLIETELQPLSVWPGDGRAIRLYTASGVS